MCGPPDLRLRLGQGDELPQIDHLLFRVQAVAEPRQIKKFRSLGDFLPEPVGQATIRLHHGIAQPKLMRGGHAQARLCPRYRSLVDVESLRFPLSPLSHHDPASHELSLLPQ